MKPSLLHLPTLAMLMLAPLTYTAQNLPPIAINDTASVCGNTETIYVQNNDINPDGDIHTISIYVNPIHGFCAISNGAINYTPTIGYTGPDSIVYILRDNGAPPMRDTATVFLHVSSEYAYNTETTICEGDSVFAGGNWQTEPGMYIDTFITAAGCDSIITLTLNVNPLVPANIIANGPTSICGYGSVTLTATNGVAWLWSTGATTQSITVTSTGNYFVNINDGACSNTSDIVPVAFYNIPDSTIGSSGPLSFCEGDSVILTAADGSSWQWSNGETTQSIIADSTTTVSVIVTGEGGCISQSNSVSVTTFPAPQATIAANGPTSFCYGDSVQLTANAGSGWTWSNGATTQTITVYESGNYTVTVNYGICSSTSAPVQVVVPPSPSDMISQSGAATFCERGSVTLTANGGNSWIWSTGETTQSITVNTSGEYFVNVDYGFCSQTSPRLTVTVYPNPDAAISASGPLTFCEGDSVILSASDGTFWMWTTGESTQSITVTESGEYSTIVYNQFGCFVQSPSVSVTVNPAPAAFIATIGPTTVCEGQSVTLYANAGQSYLWSNGDTAQGITVETSGYYSVTVNYGICSSTSDPVTVIVLPAPVAKITTSGSTNLCQGESVTLYALGGTIHYWSNGSPMQNITVSDSGTYWVIVSNGACSDTSSPITVTVNPLPVSNIDCVTSFFCEGDSVMLTASPGTSWLWSNGATTQSIYWYTSGVCDVSVTDANGCSSISETLVLTAYPLPEADFVYDVAGLHVAFTNSSSGSSYNWNFGDNTTSSEEHPNHTYNAPGTYTVSLVCSNNCGSDVRTQVVRIDSSATAVYNAFSPNGDGHNDVWNIPLLANYSDNSVIIVNRWGNEVWKAEDYNNSSVAWNGRNMNDEELPDGTYYYIISYNGNELRGWVFVKR